MLDIGASEFLLIVIVAIVVIGPKDLPVAMRTAGRWIAKVRRVSGHFRSGIEAMIREAELEEMERKWREQNEAIMKAHPAVPEDAGTPVPGSAESALPPAPESKVAASARQAEQGEPQLPLPPP
jgi:sec-independent protein translocase protein TatB